MGRQGRRDRPTRRGNAFIALAAVAALAGCVGDSRRIGGDADGDADTTTTDILDDLPIDLDVTVPDVDLDVLDSIVTLDVVETMETGRFEEVDDAADTAEVVVPECVDRADCLERGGETECERWKCDDGTCTLVPQPDMTPCSNGAGVVPGTCVEGGFQPVDHCDGDGRCVDAAPPTPATTLAPALSGSWFLVYTTFGRYKDLSSARAVVNISGDTQGFSIGATHAFGAVPFGDGDGGHLCTKDDGSVEVVLPLGGLIGHQLDERLAVLTDTGSDGIAMLVRSDLGAPSQVGGTYAYFQTSIVFGQTLVTTWQGALTFEQGCLASGSIRPDPTRAGAYDFVTTSAGDCLTAVTSQDESTLVRLTTSVRAQNGDPTTYPIHYRGAVLAGGDVVLLVKEADPGTRAIEYGITILVRRTGPFTQAGLAGAWRYNVHAKVGNQAPRRDVGSVVWDTAGAITGGVVGTLDATLLTAGGWARVDSVGEGISQHVALDGRDGLDYFQRGAVDPTGRFIVGWNITTPPDPTVPQTLRDTPEGGSMLLMLRPAGRSAE